MDQGVSLDQVVVLTGHSNLNTAAKYVRPSVQDLERAVDRLAGRAGMVTVLAGQIGVG